MKTIKGLILFILLGLLTLTVFADDGNQLVYQYHNPDITIEFEEPLNVSEERQQEIADEIAGIGSCVISDSNVLSPNNIICTIIGHNLSTTTVTATHHKVHVYDPRCLLEIYHVSACSRCNYTDSELVSSVFIVCCPVDQ